jgi:uncharacterized protein (TIGR00290 family)
MYLASWSGGKDGCLACYRAIRSGYRVSALVNFISEEYGRVRFHGTEARMIGHQAELAGVPLIQKETASECYEAGFKEAVRSAIPRGIRGMVFGDIYVDEHREWVERVCRELGIEAVEPLWGEKTGDLLNEFMDSGFEAVIVSGQGEFVEKRWIGKKVDREFIGYLKERGADICGEKGEYHTFVTGGPLFNGRIEITDSAVIERNGFWLLDIKDFEIQKPPLAAQKGDM